MLLTIASGLYIKSQMS